MLFFKNKNFVFLIIQTELLLKMFRNG